MKRLRRIWISILVISLFLGCVGCNKAEETSSNGLTPVEGEYLVNEGATEYKIVVPEKADGLILIAASELSKFVSEATGVSISVVTDNKIKSSDKFISIGETVFLQDTDISYTHDEPPIRYKSSSFVIILYPSLPSSSCV